MAAWLVRREERTFGVETERGSSGWKAVVFEEREESLVEVWGLGLRRQTRRRRERRVSRRDSWGEREDIK